VAAGHGSRRTRGANSCDGPALVEQTAAGPGGREGGVLAQVYGGLARAASHGCEPMRDRVPPAGGSVAHRREIEATGRERGRKKEG
jgi:hypothetical protein